MIPPVDSLTADFNDLLTAAETWTKKLRVSIAGAENVAALESIIDRIGITRYEWEFNTNHLDYNERVKVRDKMQRINQDLYNLEQKVKAEGNFTNRPIPQGMGDAAYDAMIGAKQTGQKVINLAENAASAGGTGLIWGLGFGAVIAIGVAVIVVARKV